jgi:hypothetical protein
MPKEYLFLVRISMERSLAGPSRAEPKAAQITGAIDWPVAGNSDGFGTRPYVALGTLPQELCAANARRGDTAPKAGLLLSSDIETE